MALGIGAGAAQGLESVLSDLYQKALLKQRDAQLAEQVRQAQAQEGLTLRGQDLVQGRFDTTRADEQAAAEQAAAQQRAIEEQQAGFIAQNPHLAPMLQAKNLFKVDVSDPHKLETPDVHGVHEAATRKTEFDDFTAREGVKLKGQLRVIGAQNAATPRNERLVQVEGPDGRATWVRESDAVGKPAAQAARAVTGAERGALAYYNRAKDAEDTISSTDSAGTSLEDRVTKAGVMTQAGLQFLPNFMQSSDMQAYRQAQRAFTEARLRKESGAAIPEGEYENDAKTYFGQPGDTPATIEQKRQKRQTVLEGLKFSSGRAFDEFFGQPQQPSGGGGDSAARAAELLKKYGGG